MAPPPRPAPLICTAIGATRPRATAAFSESLDRDHRHRAVYPPNPLCYSRIKFALAAQWRYLYAGRKDLEWIRAAPMVSRPRLYRFTFRVCSRLHFTLCMADCTEYGAVACSVGVIRVRGFPPACSAARGLARPPLRHGDVTARAYRRDVAIQWSCCIASRQVHAGCASTCAMSDVAWAGLAGAAGAAGAHSASTCCSVQGVATA